MSEPVSRMCVMPLVKIAGVVVRPKASAPAATIQAICPNHEPFA